MIDVCPVGALTSKPFRYAARTWELARRRSVSPHDSLGSNLIVQTKGDRVLRVVPFDNPAVNECWISDKDRYSYDALASDDRLIAPMIKEGGEWRTVDWPQALDFVVRGLKTVTDEHGGKALGTVVSPHSTLEEMALAARLTRALGSDNVDFRLRQSDFRGDGQCVGIPWLGMPIADLDALDRALVIGSFLRKDHPLTAQRLRHAARKGAEISLLHSVADDSRIRLAHSFVAVPSLLPQALAEIVVAAAKGAGKPVPAALADIEPVAAAEVIAASLVGGERKAILLGNYAEQHLDASQLFALAQALADIVGARLGCLTEAANSVGGYVADAMPQTEDGLNAWSMFAQARKAYLVLGAEPEFDLCGARSGPRCTREGRLRRRDVAVPARHAVRRCAAPHQPVHRDGGHVRQLRGPVADVQRCREASGRDPPRVEGAARAGVAARTARLRFRVDRRCARIVADRLPTSWRTSATTPGSRSTRRLAKAAGFERVADVPIHFADPLVRRAWSLQQTADAKPPRARMNALTLAEVGVAEGVQVRVRQAGGEAVLVGRDGRRRAGRRDPDRRRAPVDQRARWPVRSRHRGARVAWMRCMR